MYVCILYYKGVCSYSNVLQLYFRIELLCCCCPSTNSERNTAYLQRKKSKYTIYLVNEEKDTESRNTQSQGQVTMKLSTVLIS